MIDTALRLVSGKSRRDALTFGEKLFSTREELDALVDKARRGALSAVKVDITEGDVRYWAVDPSESPVVQRLLRFGRERYQHEVGEPPACAFVMINHIDAATCPKGSGGGWHRDSFAAQYKAFAYLSDVQREELGAFCFVPGSNSLVFLGLSALHRMWSGGHRYSDAAIRALGRFGFRYRPILLEAGLPFFVNTSLIHRGLPILTGERLMATIYMFATPASQSPAAQILGGKLPPRDDARAV